MRYTLVVALSLLVYVLHFDSAIAQQSKFDGTAIYRACSDNAVSAETGFCYGFISGSLQELYYTRGGESSCAPPDMPFEQMRLIVMNYMTAHPERMGFPGVGVVIGAVTDAFPCHTTK